MEQSVLEKYKRKNKILFDRNSECLEPLAELICRQNHRTLVLWALDCAKDIVRFVAEKYPEELRLENAVFVTEKWSRGEITMTKARPAILDAHNAAKDKDKVCAAMCHAVGQGCAAVHTEAHAIGLPFYELSAIVFLHGIDDCDKYVDEKIRTYIDKLLYWQKTEPTLKRSWAKFLLKENVPNKELLAREKMKNKKNLTV